MLEGYLTHNQLHELVEKDPPASIDYESILNECKKSLQKAINADTSLPEIVVESLPESDPLVKLLEILAYRELHIRQRINEEKQSCRLATAHDDYLRRFADLFHVFGDKKKEILKQLFLEQYKKPHTAGSEKGYEYFAWQAFSKEEKRDLVDVNVKSPGPGIVIVSLLFDRRLYIDPDNQTEAEIQLTGKRKNYLDKVQLKLGDKSIRPIGHKVEVNEANLIPYIVKARLGINNKPGAAEVLKAAINAVKKYTNSRFRFGANVYRSGIISALQQPGVNYIDLDPLTADKQSQDVMVESGSVAIYESPEVIIDSDPPTEKVRNAQLIQKTGESGQPLTWQLIFEPVSDETRITHYVVYWGIASGQQMFGLPPVAVYAAGGEKKLAFSTDIIPEQAKSLVIHTANQNGEMEHGFPVMIPLAENGVKKT